MMRRPNLIVTYDRPVDVLHVVLGKPVPYEGDGLAGGVEIDYSLADDKPVGAKVIGFKRYGWATRVDKLASVLRGHLPVREGDLLSAIRRETEGA